MNSRFWHRFRRLGPATAVTAGVLATLSLLTSSAALAHHSYGMFDRTKETTITGTVEEFQWTNPHSRLMVKVPNSSGVLETWEIETGPPGQLARSGWKRNSVKAGDKVKVTVHPLTDGKPGGHLMMVTTADGRDFYDILFKKPPAEVAKPD